MEGGDLFSFRRGKEVEGEKLTKNNVTEVTLAKAETRTGYSVTPSAPSKSAMSCVGLMSSEKEMPSGALA